MMQMIYGEEYGTSEEHGVESTSLARHKDFILEWIRQALAAGELETDATVTASHRNSASTTLATTDWFCYCC